MYKVFVNDNPIILTDSNDFSEGFQVFNFQDINIEEWVEKLFLEENVGVILKCESLEKNWQSFTSFFNVEIAAGGKVINKANDVLFIYRFGKWDLPKGKLENNEKMADCAIREVQEECGIQNLEILAALDTTYHIFKRDDTLILKITHWYLMKTAFKGILTPQVSEGIEIAAFKNEIEIQKALKNTYKNIKLLF